MPQLFVATFLISTPICLFQAQASLALALASPLVAQVSSQALAQAKNSNQSLQENQGYLGTSSAFGLSQRSQLLHQSQLGQTGQGFQNLLRTTGLLHQGEQISPSSLQSAIDNIKSSLSNYKTKLSQLQAETLKDPSLQSKLDQAISNTTQQIKNLQAQLATAQQDLDTYTQASKALQQALAKYAQAQTQTQQAQALLATSQSNYLDKADTLAQFKQAQANAEQQLTSAKNQLDQAQQELTTATSIFDAQVIITNTAKQELDQETKNKTQALMFLNSAKAQVPNSSQLQAEYDQAHQTTQSVIDTYNQYINTYNTVYSNYQQAQATYLQTQQDLATAQSNYENNLIADPASNLPIATKGLKVDIYNQLTSSRPARDAKAYHFCKTETLTQINNNWGGGNIEGCGNDYVMLHYTGYITPDQDITYLQNSADDGFYMELDGKTVINDWTLKGCGGNWYQVSLKKGQTYKLDAWFYEWGGGACSTLNYQSNNNWGTVPAEWYTQSQPAPMIHDPILLANLQEAQRNADTASANWTQAQVDQQTASQATTDQYYLVISTATTENSLYTQLQDLLAQQASAQQEVQQAQTAYDQAVLAEQQAQSLYNTNQSNLDTIAQNKALATDQVATYIINAKTADSTLTQAIKDTATAQSATDQASTEQQVAQANADQAQQQEATALADTTAQQSNNDQASQQAQTTASEADSLATVISFDAIQTLFDQPAPQPQPEPEPQPDPQPQGDPNIPEVITDLTQVNLDAVDPSQLSDAQVQQLQDAANEVFLTAEQGSPEYAQALDALYLAAQADDIVIDQSLAEIPGIGQAAVAIANVLNLVSNIGSDISPKERKKAQNLVVTTLVVGQIAQTAALASASSGGSFRRKK